MQGYFQTGHHREQSYFINRSLALFLITWVTRENKTALKNSDILCTLDFLSLIHRLPEQITEIPTRLAHTIQIFHLSRGAVRERGVEISRESGPNERQAAVLIGRRLPQSQHIFRDPCNFVRRKSVPWTSACFTYQQWLYDTHTF